MSETNIAPVDQLLPNKLFILPLSGRPIFPGVFMPVMVNNPDDVRSVEEAYSGSGFVGISLVKNETDGFI